MTAWWVPIIAAGAALLGVVIGQQMQARRDDVRWTRERERDRDQLQEQRAKDELAWQRETQYRFASIRTELYTDLLSALQRCNEQFARRLANSDYPGLSGEDRIVIMGVRREATEQADAALQAADAAAMRLSLIAPRQVADHANDTLGAFKVAAYEVRRTEMGNPDGDRESRARLNESNELRRRLHELMREDLTPEAPNPPMAR